MRIGLVEDNPYDQESLTAVLRTCRAASRVMSDSPAEEERLDSISCFSDAGEFFASWRLGSFDVLFLDCYLPGDVTGVDVARQVRAAGDEAPIVFVTSSVDFAVEGYDVGAVGYVVKPPRADAVAAALERAEARLRANAAASGGAHAVADGGADGADAVAGSEAVGVGGMSAAAARDAVGAGGAVADGDVASGDAGVRNVDADTARSSASNYVSAPHVIEARGIGGAPVAIDLRALRWCTTSGHYLDVALERADGSLEVMRVRMRFKDLLDAASGIPSLYSCMRGCLVDLAFAVCLEESDFVLRDGTRMPISRQNLARARDRFAAQAFSRMREEADGGRHAN